jgi:hypothetical protein
MPLMRRSCALNLGSFRDASSADGNWGSDRHMTREEKTAGSFAWLHPEGFDFLDAALRGRRG